MKLDELDHESIIWAGYSSFLLDELFGLFVIVAKFEDYESDYERDWSRYSLDAVNQHVCLILLAIKNQIYYDIEQALDVFILRVFQEES